MREVLRYIFVMEVTKVFMWGGAQTFWDGGEQALRGVQICQIIMVGTSYSSLNPQVFE